MMSRLFLFKALKLQEKVHLIDNDAKVEFYSSRFFIFIQLIFNRTSNDGYEKYKYYLYFAAPYIWGFLQ